MALEAHRHGRAEGVSASRHGSAKRRSAARPSCCMPSRGSATPCSSRAMCRSVARMGAQGRARSAAGAEDAAGRTSTASPQIVARGEKLPPLRSALPARQPAARLQDRARRTSRRDIPYLRALRSRHLAKWRPRLEKLPSPRVALAWSGRAAHPNDRNRSLSLAQLKPLLVGAGHAASSACSATCATPMREALSRRARHHATRRRARRFRRHRRGAGAVRSASSASIPRSPMSRARSGGRPCAAAAVPAGLALDARSRREPLVSGDPAVPPGRAPRLGRRDRARASCVVCCAL